MYLAVVMVARKARTRRTNNHHKSACNPSTRPRFCGRSQILIQQLYHSSTRTSRRLHRQGWRTSVRTMNHLPAIHTLRPLADPGRCTVSSQTCYRSCIVHPLSSEYSIVCYCQKHDHENQRPRENTAVKVGFHFAFLRSISARAAARVGKRSLS
jgi:hypothetical protein